MIMSKFIFYLGIYVKQSFREDRLKRERGKEGEEFEEGKVHKGAPPLSESSSRDIEGLRPSRTSGGPFPQHVGAS